MDKAASELYRDLGNLRDFPSDLRNTIGSLYYEYWWFQTTDDLSSGHPSWPKQVVIRMSLYQIVPDLVKNMRGVRRTKELITHRQRRLSPELLFNIMVGTTKDMLRYDLKFVSRKSVVRRAVEKAFKKPFYEVPGVYNLIENALGSLKFEEIESSSPVEEPDGLSRSPVHDQERSEQPATYFIAELPCPDHSKVVKAFQYNRYSITYYRNPKSYGEVVADIPPIYRYPQVAVIESQNEPISIIRTEVSLNGTIFLCSLSRNGDHRNYGPFLYADAASFLKEVVEKVSTLDTNKNSGPRDGAVERVIVNCPSCNSAFRVPKGKSGKVRCKTCGRLFETRT